MNAIAIVLRLLLVTVMPALACANPFVIDDGRYASGAAAQAAWRPMKGTAPAAAVELAGRAAIRLPCNFEGTDFERASWDRAVAVNLASCRGIQFDFHCPDIAPVAQFSLYLQSGSGWYAATFQPGAVNAWCTVILGKDAFRIEGQPAGWHRISTIRLSAWRAHNTNTEMRVSNLRVAGAPGAGAPVAVLRAVSAARAGPAEARGVDRFTDAIARGFESFGIACSTPGDDELAAAQLRGTKLVVLPCNPTVPASTLRVLVDFLDGGGQLLAFHALPAGLRSAVGIETGRVLNGGERPARFAAIRFAPGALPGAPPLVKQRSWNVRAAKPVSNRGFILAEWLDEQGRPAGQPAVVASANCVFMTDVLSGDDLANQRRMLLATAGRLAPDLWREAVVAAIAKIGEIGGCKDFETAAALVAQKAGQRESATHVLAEARSLREQARQLSLAARFPEAMDHARLAAQRMMEAFCLAQTHQPAEFRGFWCHSAFGVEGMDWDEAIRRLADAGFTAILPNMLWGGVAFYPSTVLPVAADVGKRGDQIARCLAAAAKYGIEVHVWKVNWNIGRHAPADFLERMRRARRLQVSSQEKEEPWLCPSHPENQALEIAAMVEVARRYAVDGIHFDYIRYPSRDHCFCGGCRERFERAIGVPIGNWPRDLLAAGAGRERWLEWRRDTITGLVRAVSEQTRAMKPGIRISAAVFRNWTADRDSVGQDWKQWCERGWVDFVCPMDYTGSDAQFENWVAWQKTWAAPTPVFPGIGASASNARLPADRVIGQIQITRRHDTGGFVIFNYGVSESRELAPLLGLGTTANR